MPGRSRARYFRWAARACLPGQRKSPAAAGGRRHRRDQLRRGFWARHSPTGAWQYPIPDDASKETVDWQRYISNTTQLPLTRCASSAGATISITARACRATSSFTCSPACTLSPGLWGPRRSAPWGGLRYWKGEVPDVLLGMFDYPETEVHPALTSLCAAILWMAPAARPT